SGGRAASPDAPVRPDARPGTPAPRPSRRVGAPLRHRGTATPAGGAGRDADREADRRDPERPRARNAAGAESPVRDGRPAAPAGDGSGVMSNSGRGGPMTYLGAAALTMALAW